jgi:hypothetical protein
VLPKPRLSEFLNLAAGIVVLACALPLPVFADGQRYFYWNETFILDGLSAWVVLCTAAVYFLASIFASATCGRWTKTRACRVSTRCLPPSRSPR